jgi:DNA modification methylase
MTAPYNKWPADKVERRPIAALIPYARNARTHSDEQVAQVAASMREWGWTNPVLVDEAGTIIAGHCRVLAARQLGLAEVPVMIAEGWSEAKKRAYVLADNQLALNAGWDMPMLGAELQGLKEWGFDLSLLGFADLDALMAGKTEGLTDPDEAPPLPAEPVTKPGDLWACGNHRVLCGDSTVGADVERLLAGVKPNLMVTDPPYGVNYHADWRNEADRANGKPSGARAVGKVRNDDRLDWSEAYALFPGDVGYFWHASRHASEVQRSIETAGFTIRSQIIWAKTRFVIGRGDYHWQHEPCWYAVRKKGDWRGDRSQSTLWTIDHQVSETGHSTQKPVECMRRPIVNNSSPGQAVYDPFVGSGTTMIAAEMEGRSALCLEIDPGYCDVAVKRWENFTGKQAKHETARA